MSEIYLIDSICSKNKDYNHSYELLRYNEIYYIGLNLYRNFENYLAGNYSMSVYKTTSSIDAQKYFNNIESKLINNGE